MIESDITALISRLARPHPSGGRVIERAAIVAQGKSAPAVIDWILSHGGTPEVPAASRRGATASRGLHGARLANGNSPATLAPSRFVLPADALDPR